MADFLLRDGSRLGDLVDHDNRRIGLRACADEEIYQLELERLFARAWQCLAHASELDQNAYVHRTLGEDPVILSRNGQGGLHCVLDCGRERERRGWVDHAHSSCLEEAPQVRLGEYAGFVFGTWDASAPELAEYLGSMGWYLRMMFERTDRGLEVAGPPQRWRIKANWKLAADQFSGDAYHALTLHRSLIEAGGGINDGFLVALRSALSVSLQGGHGTTARDSRFRIRGAGADIEGSRLPPPGVPPELLDQVDAHLDKEQLQFLCDFPPGASSGHVFPNMSMLMNPIMMADGRLGTNFTVRCWLPRGPDEMEACVWCLVERDASDEYKERVRHTTITNFSVSGIFEQDDAEAWVGIQRNLRGSQARKGFMTYTASRPAEDLVALNGRMGPLGDGDRVFRGWPRDERQWRFWLRWLEYMQDEPWKQSRRHIPSSEPSTERGGDRVIDAA